MIFRILYEVSFFLFQLCFPRGLKFQMNERPDPSFHSFLLTREDGSKVYGCSLIFYEKVENENICAAMLTLSNMYVAEKESPRLFDESSSSKKPGSSPIVDEIDTKKDPTL